MRTLFPHLREVLKVVNTAHASNEQVALKTISKAIIAQGVVDKFVRLPSEIDIGKLVGKYAQTVSLEGQKTGIIVHRRYNELDPFSDPNYLEIRFGLAKEMMHAFDSEEEKTRQHQQVVVDLMELLLDKTIFDGKRADYYADKRAVYGAIELLVRYEVRVPLVGGFAYHHALNSGDWSYIGKQFGVPASIAEFAFNKQYIEYIKQQREICRITDHPFHEYRGN